MGRPVFPNELTDPDFSWLLSTFLENYAHYTCIENASLPVVLIADPDYEDLQYPEDLAKKNLPDYEK